jgi:hypothetical protein
MDAQCSDSWNPTCQVSLSFGLLTSLKLSQYSIQSMKKRMLMVYSTGEGGKLILTSLWLALEAPSLVQTLPGLISKKVKTVAGDVVAGTMPMRMSAYTARDAWPVILSRIQINLLPFLLTQLNCVT